MLMDALLTAASNRGAKIHADFPVNSMMLDGNRCTGVST
jgi:phytoene dehydrogenase-like protein